METLSMRRIKAITSAMLVTVLIVALCSCETNKSFGSSNATSNVQSSTAQSTLVQSTSKQTNSTVTRKIGDIAELDSLKISFLSGKQYASIKGDTYTDKPKDGNVYVVFAFEFENIGTKDENISSADFDCYVDGYATDTKIILNTPPEGEPLLMSSIAGGKKVVGCLIYEIKSDWKEIELTYDNNIFSNSNEKLKYIITPSEIAK